MKGRKRWVIAGVLVVVAALIAVIMLTGGAPPGNGGNGTPSPPRPWIVKYGHPTTGLGGVIGIDPQTSSTIVAFQTAEILFLSDPETREPTPFLAIDLEYNEEESYVDIFLREGVRFHNGDNMTAEDVKFSYDRMKDVDLVGGWAPIYQRWIDRVEVIDDYQVRIYWTEGEEGSPRKDFPLQPVIVPKNYIEEVGWEEWAEKPVLTGPFKIVDWARDVYIHFVKAFDEHWYWGDLPNYDELIILSVPEASTRLAMLKTGELDAAVVPPANVPDVDSDPNLTRVMSEWCYSWDIVFYDMGNPDQPSPLHDPKVRKAVSLAIDRARIGENVLFGTHEPKGSYWAPYSFGYRYREPDPYDPDEARRLLEEAGYPDGFDTSFAYPMDQSAKAAQAVIASLSEVGIRAQDVALEPTTWGVKCYYDQHVGMGYMWMPGWGGRYYPEDVFGDELYSYAAQVSRNNTEVTEAYERMLSAEDEEEYMQAAWAAEELVYDVLGYKIPVWAVHTAYAYGPTIDSWQPWQGIAEQGLVEIKYKG